jgi:methionyl-tRNA formyltransferase
MRIIFFGTPSLAARVLRDLLSFPSIDIVAVVTRVDKPKGRHGTPQPSAVKEMLLATAPNIPLHQPVKASTEEFAQILSQYEADLFLVVAYGEIISQRILDIPQFYCLNVHGSILPKYRGAAPMQRALMDGVEEFGVTLMKMVKGLDAGDIASIETFPVPLDMDLAAMEDSVYFASMRVLKHFMGDFAKGEIAFSPQDHSEATYAAKITSADCWISWDKKLLHIHNQIRALSPRPGARCKVMYRDQIEIVKLIKTSYYSKGNYPEDLANDSRVQEDSLFFTHQQQLFYARQGELLCLELVQREGKKVVSGFQLWQGGQFSWE